jgi:hypothetical protein
MFLIGLGALLVLGGFLYMALLFGGDRLAARIPPADSRHSGAATTQRAILRARNELAGHSHGNRCNSVGIGSRFWPRPPARVTSAAPRHQIDAGRISSFK